jgi:L-alanine-DL-glutamate epimerase-like enolase superfamily enzyme
MPDLASKHMLSVTQGIRNGLRIEEVRTTIIDIPTVRAHKLSSLSTSCQNYVLVRIRTTDGVEGIGEASTLGGPRWSEESVESIKANIDSYLAPAILGETADGSNSWAHAWIWPPNATTPRRVRSRARCSMRSARL